MSSLRIADINPDLPAVKQRWDAWWNNAMVDRPVIRVTASLATPRPEIAPQANLWVDPTTQWTDADFMVRRMVETLRVTYYGGDALPIANNPISAGHAMYFGARPNYGPYTVSIDPAPSDDGAYPSLDGWEQSDAWQMAQRHVGTLAAQSRGRWLVAPFWGNGPADTLAAVRGFEQFYIDLAEDRDAVARASAKITPMIWRAYRRLEELAWADSADGYASILGYWSSKPIGTFDADISCNISPRDFQEIFLPPMVEAMKGYPRNSYHLDGPGALRHLDALLALKDLHAIQWVHGAGRSVLDSLPVVQKIQAAGKAVQVNAAPEEIPELLKHVRPEGLCIATWAASEDDARRTVDRVAKQFAK